MTEPLRMARDEFEVVKAALDISREMGIDPPAPIPAEQLDEFRERLAEAMENPVRYQHKVLPPQRPGRPARFEGVIRIEWRNVTPAAPSHAWVLPGWAFAIYDEHGNPITTVAAVSIHADVDTNTWAECEMFADADGRPIISDGKEDLSSRWVMTDDGPATAVFPFLVASMSVVS